MTSKASGFLRLVVVATMVASVLAVGGRASAGQNITTDATIVGQVTDESKAAIPGVTVTATSPALQVPSVVAVTDARGEYRLTPLPIGIYTVEYALSGFQTVKQEGVRLTAGFTAKLDVSLKVGSLTETITVSGAAPIVDVSATNTVTQITKEALETIPTGRNGYIGLMQMTPGARPPLDVGGNTNNANPTFQAFGQSGQAWQSIDGVATKNPRVSDSGNYFDFSAFEEATVATVGHDASIPSRGVAVNAVITSGSNLFHGKIFYSGTSSTFQSGGAEAGGADVKIRDDLQGELGGRLIRDRLWFWVGARTQRDAEDSLDCKQASGAPCRQKQDSHFLTTKWTGQISKSNRLTGFYMMMRGIGEEGFSSLISWDARRVQPLTPSVFKVEWQGLKGNALVFTANWGGWEGHSGSVCPDGSTSLSAAAVDLSSCTQGIATTDAVTAVVTGLNTRAGERLLESRYQGRINVGYFKPDLFMGNHEIKSGLDIFYAPQNRHQVGRGAAGNYQLQFRSGVSDRINLWNYPVHPSLVLKYYGGYVADSWTVQRKLTLNLGIRYAYDEGIEHATCRSAADGPSAAIYPAACFPDVKMPVFKTFAPRLRAAYDMFGDGKTVIKGGWGRYQSQRTADQVQLVAKDVLDTSTFRWRDNGNRVFDAGESILDPNGTDFISRTSGGLVGALQGGVINPDEKTPRTDEFLVQFERQLSSALAFRLTGVESRVTNAQRVANLLRPYDAYNIPVPNADPGPDGRVGTSDDPGKTVTYFDYPAALAGSAFQKVQIVNDSKANEQYHSMETAVSKRLSNGWQFMISYTATKKHIPLQTNAGAFNTQDPNSEINAADNTWEWMTRVSGSYLFHYGVLVSTNFESRSGTPLARTASLTGAARVGSLTARVEPIGSIRLPTINIMNLRGEKTITLREGHSLVLRANLYNAMNTNVATAMTVQSGASFGLVTGRVLPRIADFQMQYRF